MLPGFDGDAALALARERIPQTPFIFVSGTMGEENAVAALQKGANDYIIKHLPARLPSAVARATTTREISVLFWTPVSAS